MQSEQSSRGLRAAFYGDDFTGSVDALLQFSRRGWRGRLFVGLPGDDALAQAAASCDVVGIAGIARSLSTDRLDDELRPVFQALTRLGPHVLQYKACSTADSSPAIGSIGRVIEIGREVVSDAPVPMLFAQPDFGRYTVFGHHFAAEGATVYRLDRQPTMSTHPTTPMTESDLAVHLGRQTALPIGAVAHTAFGAPGDLAAALHDSPAAALVLDALDETHLVAIGEAIRSLPGPVFAVGSGGLSHGVAAADPGSASPPPTRTSSSGPILAVSGSRSAQTRRQADAAAAAGWLVRPLPLDGSDAVLDEVIAALGAGRSVVLTSDDADIAAAADRPVLEAIAECAASVVSAAVRAGATGRVIVCGGDTSSRITGLLGVGSLSIAANPWANIVLLRAHAADPAIDGLELLLKGGQVGEVDLFDRILALGEPGL
ncbi:four-carbon acid sugar kinase family protein [Microbacterium rhizomatis]|uniref:four-carbon acid sugar kinase family protein n=1 Tax=Microbacterium rhizomatis TaxID=1631477 RepID=UPI001FE6C2A4|nr:four-carbon acid sugar kinase family protein [Microbacterium rhizomatis]